MIERAKRLVENLMFNENTGHGMEHINRVLDLSLKFAESEDCNREIVALIALLHDVDDYKIFGATSQENLTNTNAILNELSVEHDIGKIVVDNVAKIGYSKRLKGVVPPTIEGQIVSDADMCDALGANGILRVHQYELKHNKPFFDRDVWPMEEVNGQTYGKKCSDSAVCHMFEKILKLKDLILTESGMKEANERHDFVVYFLKQLFKEEKAYDWQQFLDSSLEKN